MSAGAIPFSASQDCGTVKLIRALLMLVYPAGTRLMYWYTVPGGVVAFVPGPGCTVPVTTSPESLTPVTVARPAAVLPAIFTVTVMGRTVERLPVVPEGDGEEAAGPPSSSLRGDMVAGGIAVSRTTQEVWPSTRTQTDGVPRPAAVNTVAAVPSTVSAVRGETVPGPLTENVFRIPSGTKLPPADAFVPAEF